MTQTVEELQAQVANLTAALIRARFALLAAWPCVERYSRSESVRAEVQREMGAGECVPTLESQEPDELGQCAFCGARVENPCDEPPSDTCEKALNATYGSPVPPLGSAM